MLKRGAESAKSLRKPGQNRDKRVEFFKIVQT